MRYPTGTLATLVLLALALGGCGQTGALYLPEDEAPASVPEDDAEPTAEDS